MNTAATTNTGYVAGSMKADAARLGRNGWIMGVFFKDDDGEDTRATGIMEVKYWEYEKGGGQSHVAKTSETIEWSVILAGKVKARLGEDDVVLQGGDYVIIQPGTPNNLVSEVLEDVIAVTVKAPSDPAAKKPIAPLA